jgi:hypothetical protein
MYSKWRRAGGGRGKEGGARGRPVVMDRPVGVGGINIRWADSERTSARRWSRVEVAS